jgi:hypothetical protein
MMSVSITISNSIQTAKGRERDEAKKKPIRIWRREQRNDLASLIFILFE